MRLLFLTFCLWLAGVAGAASQSPDPEASSDILDQLLAAPEYSSPKLSPSGRYLAFYAQSQVDGEGDVLIVRDLDAPDGPADRRASFGDLSILEIHWANEDRILVTVASRGGIEIVGRAIRFPVSRVMSVPRETLTNAVALFDDEGRNVTGNLRNLELNDITDLLPDDPDHILMSAWRGRAHHLWRVNVHTGEADVAERGNSRTAMWFTGPDGYAVMRVEVSARGRRVTVFTRDQPRSRWRRAASYRINELSDLAPEFEWAGLSDDPNMIYVYGRPEGAGRNNVYLYDLANGTYAETVATHERVDIDSTLVHPRTRRYVGHVYVEDRQHFVFADTGLQRHLTGIEGFFGGEVSVVPLDLSGNRMTLYVSGPTEPGAYYVYDTEARSIDPLYLSRPGIPLEDLSPVEIVHYTTRDGLELTGYLTRPAGRAGMSVPLVVMPHGGPEMRDVYDFDPVAQYLAYNGYAVFQPNFRGSSGYGDAFAEAGYRQWGGAMQDDVTDGVEHLIATGRAARDRICIMGFSYGGYSALIGGALAPDAYQCVIASAAATDLPAFVEGWRDRDEDAYEYWREVIGDPETDSDRLHQVSPVNLASHYRAPVLLFHGDADQIVPVEQSRMMAMALENAGMEYRYDELPGIGHSLTQGANLREQMNRSVWLLNRTIGPQRFGSDPFADWSSLASKDDRGEAAVPAEDD